MNERIRKLIRNLDNEIGRYYWTDKEKEKFAELIVRECAEIVEETRWMVPPSQEQIARSIKQLFGVK